MHTADARLFESCGEAAGAATVEADYVDAPRGDEFRCVDAHRFADRYRSGMVRQSCAAVYQCSRLALWGASMASRMKFLRISPIGK